MSNPEHVSTILARVMADLGIAMPDAPPQDATPTDAPDAADRGMVVTDLAAWDAEVVG